MYTPEQVAEIIAGSLNNYVSTNENKKDVEAMVRFGKWLLCDSEKYEDFCDREVGDFGKMCLKSLKDNNSLFPFKNYNG